MNAKILIVEDNEMSRNMLSKQLTRKGFCCIVAVNGQQAIDLANTELPDFILMDMSLPVKSGADAIREIKETDDTKHIPILALTSIAISIDSSEKALNAGCNDYESKPIAFSQLLERIKKLLPSTTSKT